MNKKSNVNIKNTVNSESSKTVEENKKQSTNILIDNKEKKIIEDLKNDQNSNKPKKENTKNKAAVSETDDKLIPKEDKLQNNNAERTGKNPNQIKKNVLTKEEIKSPDDLSTKTLSNKKYNMETSEKINKLSQSKGIDQDSNKAKSISNEFEEYVENSGLTLAFKIIFPEITNKHINQENLFQYTAIRLRQIG